MRATDERFRDDNERRVERMNAWIELAEATPHDHVRFVFYWIAYEAGYQDENRDTRPEDRKQRERFHDELARRDRGKLRGILQAQRKDVVRIIELRQAHPSFWTRWQGDADVDTAAEWEIRFRRRVESTIDRLNKAVRSGIKREISATLNNLFRSLSIVRHQIVHGGSAGPRSRGRTQVILGAGLLRTLVPCFRDSIESNIDQDWGEPPYPRVGSMADEKCPPPWL